MGRVRPRASGCGQRSCCINLLWASCFTELFGVGSPLHARGAAAAAARLARGRARSPGECPPERSVTVERWRPPGEGEARLPRCAARTGEGGAEARCAPARWLLRGSCGALVPPKLETAAEQWRCASSCGGRRAGERDPQSAPAVVCLAPAEHTSRRAAYAPGACARGPARSSRPVLPRRGRAPLGGLAASACSARTRTGPALISASLLTSSSFQAPPPPCSHQAGPWRVGR